MIEQTRSPSRFDERTFSPIGLKKLITQTHTAEELGLSARQVRRLLRGMKENGDKVIVRGLRGGHRTRFPSRSA